MSGQLHAPDTLHTKVRAPSTHWMGAWVGTRTGLDAVVKKKIPIFAPAGN